MALLGFERTYSCVKKYIRKIKKKTNIFVRIHTLPGEKAQVDFGYAGLTPDNTGKKRAGNSRDFYIDYYD